MSKIEYELNRKTYLMIKKMDHQEMKEYLNAVYQNGIKKGQASGTSFDSKKVLEAIGQIKGIGPAKLEQIKLAILVAGGKG